MCQSIHRVAGSSRLPFANQVRLLARQKDFDAALRHQACKARRVCPLERAEWHEGFSESRASARIMSADHFHLHSSSDYRRSSDGSRKRAHKSGPNQPFPKSSRSRKHHLVVPRSCRQFVRSDANFSYLQNFINLNDVSSWSENEPSRSPLSGFSLFLLIDSATDPVGNLSIKSSFEDDLTSTMAFLKRAATATL
jgi:hypothetical protein